MSKCVQNTDNRFLKVLLFVYLYLTCEYTVHPFLVMTVSNKLQVSSQNLYPDKLRVCKTTIEEVTFWSFHDNSENHRLDASLGNPSFPAKLQVSKT